MSTYTDRAFGNFILRHFPAEMNPDEIVWHRDTSDREVFVLLGYGWMFEFEHEEPFHIDESTHVHIPKMTFYRLTKTHQASDLLISIYEDRNPINKTKN